MEGDKINVKKLSVSPKSLLIHLYFLVIVRSFVFAKLYHVAKTISRRAVQTVRDCFLRGQFTKKILRAKNLVCSVYVILIQAYTYMEVRGVLAMVWGIFLVKGNHRDATLLFPFVHLTSIGANS